MATVPPHASEAEDAAMSMVPSSPLVAEYQAVVAAYKAHVDRMKPTRLAYDAVFLEHSVTKNHFIKLNEQTKTHRTNYQRHKRYFVSLTRALVTSGEILRSAPTAIDDLQHLTHAALLYKFQIASRTMKGMIYRCKRLDKARALTKKTDQEVYAKCQELFPVVDRECRELDRLHMKVLDAEKKLGLDSGCEAAERECICCRRLRGRELKRAAVEAAVEAEMATRDKKGKDENACGGNMKTESGVKAVLDNADEEWMSKELTNLSM